MDYFRQTTPKAWTPDGIYCSYRTMYPTKPRRQLLLAIKKDLELLGKDDNALVAKQAHLFLKKWSRLKFPLQEDPAESSSSAAAATATATGTHTTFGNIEFNGDIFGTGINVQVDPHSGNGEKRSHQEEDIESNKKSKKEAVSSGQREEEDVEIDELFKEANTITLTANETLDVDEVVPSTAVCTTCSMTRRLLFQWVYDLYQKQIVRMPITGLQLIKERPTVTASDALIKLAASILDDWSSADDVARYALSLSISLIIDTTNTPTTTIVRKALSSDHWKEALDVAQSIHIPELPVQVENIFKETIEILTLDHDGGKNAALRHLTQAAAAEQEHVEDSSLLQAIDILIYILRNASKWGKEGGATEVDWTHRLVTILDHLLRDTELTVRMGEKSSTAFKENRIENEKFGTQESTRTSIGRKIDVLMEHDQFELSGSEWKTPQCTQAMKDRQHNKNVRVNACILSQLLQLPFNTQQNPNVHVVTMEWTGFTGELLFVKKVDNYYVVGSLGNVYLPTTLDDLEDFRDSLKLLFYFKHHHQHLQRTIRAPLARMRRLRVSGAKFQSNGDIFVTPTRGK